MCSNGMISGLTCTLGACSGAVNCPGRYACASTTACNTDCASDADCATGRWCKHNTGVGSNTCVTRLSSGTNCNDGDCELTGCLQCNMGGNGVACPMGGGSKCP
jgi:hypothetical protein